MGRISRLTMGEHSYGTIKVIGKCNHVYVEKYTSIASGVQALMVGHNPENVSTYPFNVFSSIWPKAKDAITHPIEYGDIHIGNDCWIGFGSTIMGGVAIGDGAVIAANSVVTKNIPPYTICAGVPAEQKARRFTVSNICDLLQIRWWDWPDEKVKEYANLLCSTDISEFIRIAKEEICEDTQEV